MRWGAKNAQRGERVEWERKKWYEKIRVGRYRERKREKEAE